ncbi:MAG: histidine kinase dimerization/phospho-acceptor domain-containing protein [Aminipila sp.]
MDTKLKKFNNNLAVRVFALIMCVMLFVATLIGSIATIIGIEKAGRSFTLDEIFGTKNYLESTDLQQEFNKESNNLLQLIGDYKSEANIKAGNLLDENDGSLYDAIAQLYYDGTYYCGEKKIVANQLQISYDSLQKDGKNIPVMIINGVQYPIENYNDDELYEDMDTEEAKNYAHEYVTYDVGIENNPVVKKIFIESNKAQITEIKNTLTKNQLRSFNALKDELNSQKGMIYFVTDGANTLTNMKLATSDQGKVIPNIKEFQKNPAYMIYKGGKLTKVPESLDNASSWVRNIDQSIEDSFFTLYNDNLRVYLAFTDNYINEKQLAYQDTSEIIRLVPLIAGCGAGCIVLFLYLAVTTGRKDEEGKRKLYTLDRIWTEAQIAGIIAAGASGAWVVMSALDNWEYSRTMSSMEISILSIICAAIAVIGLWFILSCIRLLKAHCFIKSSLIYKLWDLVIYKWCGKVWNSIKDIYNGSSLMKKIVICTLGVCVLSATVFLAPLIFLVIVVFAPKWIKKFEGIKEGIEEVKNGNLTYKIPVEGDGELDRLAKSINEISEASNVAVQNELKNQRMKTDLISNVSHDLKTPLTSMVTYIDLLKTEGLDSENAPEYLRILDEKTERLRHLTEDLFEAAKASSGAMPVHLEKVELLSLINQGLGEMDQRIQASGLDFIINADRDKYYVKADGQLLWRVVENLLGNVLKYALENSRVYIDVKEIGSQNGNVTSLVTLEMKNISKNPLNINADELMERFKRGDESRTTEGSGLGLAIAKDLVKLQEGWFEVFIDGDLFKAQVMLNKYVDAN